MTITGLRFGDGQGEDLFELERKNQTQFTCSELNSVGQSGNLSKE